MQEVLWLGGEGLLAAFAESGSLGLGENPAACLWRQVHTLVVSTWHETDVLSLWPAVRFCSSSLDTRLRHSSLALVLRVYWLLVLNKWALQIDNIICCHLIWYFFKSLLFISHHVTKTFHYENNSCWLKKLCKIEKKKSKRKVIPATNYSHIYCLRHPVLLFVFTYVFLYMFYNIAL